MVQVEGVEVQLRLPGVARDPVGEEPQNCGAETLDNLGKTPHLNMPSMQKKGSKTMNIRTAHVTRTKLAVITAGLAGLAMALTACSGDTSAANGNGSDGSASPNIDGTWITSEPEGNTGEILAVNGTDVAYIAPVWENGSSCTSTELVLEHIEQDALKLENTEQNAEYQILSAGELNDAQTSVTWDDVNGSKRTGDDPGSATLTNLGETLELEYTFYRGVGDVTLVPVDSTLGQQLIETACED